MLILRYISSLCLILCCVSLAVGQTIDSTLVVPPKEKQSWKPQALRVGVDLSQIARQIIFEEFNTVYELHADLGLHSYFIVMDYGHAETQRQQPTFNYSNSGNYYRLGVDVNLLKNDPRGTVIFFGLRYATSTYDDQLFLSRVDAFGDHQLVGENKGAGARWFEANTGLKVRIWKGLYLGYTVRYKFALQLKNTTGLAPHDIPGFGVLLPDDKNAFGFNYHLFWRFKFENKD